MSGYRGSNSSGGRPPPKVDDLISLKVDNLSYRTGQEELRQLFERYGDIGDIHIPRDKWSRQSKGFAFIRFYSRRDAESAMDALDGRRVDGREIRVVMARYGRPIDERERRRGGGGRRGRSRSRSRSRTRSRTRSRSRSRSQSRSKSPRSPDRRERGSRARGGSSRSRSRSRSLSRGRSPESAERNGV